MSYRDDFRQAQSDTIWTAPRIILGLLATVVVLAVLGFVATGGDLATYKFWAPKRANAEREVFQNTQGFVQGKQEYLSRLEYNYQTAQTPDEKAGLKTLILSEASTVDNTKLTPELQNFISSLKGGGFETH